MIRNPLLPVFIVPLLAGLLLAMTVHAPTAYATPGVRSAPALAPAVAPAGPDKLFTAQGHLLSFRPGALYVTNASEALHMEFVGAARVAPQGDAAPPLGGPGAPPLQRVTYANLWDGITLSYAAVPGGLMQSTYRLEAGADPAAIRLRYNAPLTVNDDGTLTVALPHSQITESAPLAWQEVAGEYLPVPVSFARHGATEVGFALGAFDAGRPLFIDPTMTWHTFLGGSGFDYGTAIAVDGNGNVYVAGYSDATWGTPLRAYGAVTDAFVAKLDSSGALLWNTFLGSGDGDAANAITVDNAGNVYVAGNSGSTWGSPLRPFVNLGEAFVAKLDANGALQWNTFLGGTSIDKGEAIAVDGSANVYVAGTSLATWGTPVRPFGGVYAAFAAKLNTSGALQWNTFLGGSGQVYGYGGIGVDGSGNVVIGGASTATWGSPVRSFTPGYDAFVAKLDSSGVLQWNTFLGGSGRDDGYALAVDSGGNAYLGGASDATWGTPLRAYTGFTDAFAAKVDSSGALLWHSFLGGSGDEYGQAIDLDGSGVYVGGRSSGTWGTPAQSYTSGDDVFAVELDTGGALQWNTFLGGTAYDQGFGLAVDANDGIYIGGYTGGGWGTPVRAYTDAGDAFALKISDLPPGPEIDVVGNGVPIVDGSATPNLSDHTDFGGVSINGAAVVRSFTIQNTGNLTLLLGAAAATLGNTGNNPFSVSSQPAPAVAAGNSTLVTITFAPSTAGTFADTLSIASDDSNENPFTFDIQGVGFTSQDIFAQVRKLVAGDRGPADIFGISVAMDGDTLVVGSSAEDEDASGANSLLSAGAVYIFQRDHGGTGNWGQVRKLVAGDRAIGDQFGISVAIDGDTVVVGANVEDEDAAGANTVNNAGSAYIFQRGQGGTDNWGQVRKLVAADRVADDNFGIGVAISGDTVVVGAGQEDEDATGGNPLNSAGSAYIFQRNQGGTDNWGQVRKLVAGDRGANDQFGSSVDIHADTVVVGAFGEDEDAAGTNTVNNAGSAYIFQRNQGGTDNWGQVRKLVTGDRGINDSFGLDVAIDGDTVVVGAPVEDEDAAGANTLNAAGSAYVFDRDQGGADTWGQVHKLVAADRAANDQFGWRVDIDVHTIGVGAHQEDEDAAGADTLGNAGSAYLFQRNHNGVGAWGQVNKLVARDRAADDHFGYSVAVAGDKVFIGAYLEDEDALGANPLDAAGSAYLFGASPAADLAIAKTVTLARIAPGEAITYTIHFANNGPGIAYVPTLLDSVPASITVGAVTSSTFGSGVRIAQTGGSPDFAWAISDLAAGAGGVITLTGVLGQHFAATAVITNTALITASHDITGDNNRATAGFVLTLYTVSTSTAGAGGGSIVLDSPGGTYPSGTVVTATATANPGSTFTGWSGDLAGTTSPVVLTLDGNKSITATFSLNQYLVSTAVTGSGAVTLDPPGGSYNAGTVVTVTATSNPGSTFTGWSGDLNGGTNPVTLTVDGAKSLTATFSLNQYTIGVSASPAAGGAVTGGGTVAHGGTVNALAVANSGYTFVNWTEGGNPVATTAAYAFTAAGNRTLVANFSPILYSVSIATTGTGSGAVTLDLPGGAYGYGTVVTATATANPDSQFVGWSADCTGTEPCVLTVDGNKHITATFIRITDPLPRIAMTKHANVAESIVGETAISYTYAITNTGDVTLTVTAHDDKLGAVPLVLLPGDTALPSVTLASGQVAVGTRTYTPQISDLPGPLKNRVVVTGTAAPDAILVTAQASASVDLLLRGQAQTLCFGDAITLRIDPLAATSQAPRFDLVVISGPAPAGLFLSGASQCVPYTGVAAMVDLINQLIALGCPNGTACAPFTYIVFAPDGTYYSETITQGQSAGSLFLPLIRSTCSSELFCP